MTIKELKKILRKLPRKALIVIKVEDEVNTDFDISYSINSFTNQNEIYLEVKKPK